MTPSRRNANIKSMMHGRVAEKRKACQTCGMAQPRKIPETFEELVETVGLQQKNFVERWLGWPSDNRLRYHMRRKDFKGKNRLQVRNALRKMGCMLIDFADRWEGD